MFHSKVYVKGVPCCQRIRFEKYFPVDYKSLLCNKLQILYTRSASFGVIDQVFMI